MTIELLREKLDVSESNIGLIISYRGMGQLFATLVSGYLFEYFSVEENKSPKWYSLTLNRILILCVLFLTLTSYIIPFLPSYYLLVIAQVIMGVFLSTMEIGTYLGIELMWENAEGPQQGTTLVFSGGSLIFPLIVAQIYSFFPSPEVQLFSTYGICSVLLLIPIVFLVLCTDPKKKKEDKKEEEKKNEYTNKRTKLIRKLLNNIFSKETVIYFFVDLMRMFLIGGEVCYFQFLFQYSKRRNLDTEANLSYLVSSFSVAYCISTVFSLFYSNYVKPVHILLVSFIFSLACMILLVFFDDLICLWVLSLSFAILIAPSPAMIMYYAKDSFGFELNSLNTSIMVLFQFFGELGLPAITSIISSNEIFGPRGLIYVMVVSWIFSLVALFLSIISGIVLKRKFLRKRMGFVETNINSKDEYDEVVDEINESNLEIIM